MTVPPLRGVCHIIQEEGSDSHDDKKKGWKVLRQSIQRKQLNEDLQVRKSTLKLHTMDECAVNRSSQISFKRHSVLSQLQNQPTHPAIQTMYRRKSSAFSNASDNSSIPSESSIKCKYGYSEMSVATHRIRFNSVWTFSLIMSCSCHKVKILKPGDGLPFTN